VLVLPPEPPELVPPVSVEPVLEPPMIEPPLAVVPPLLVEDPPALLLSPPLLVELARLVELPPWFPPVETAPLVVPPLPPDRLPPADAVPPDELVERPAELPPVPEGAVCPRQPHINTAHTMRLSGAVIRMLLLSRTAIDAEMLYRLKATTIFRRDRPASATCAALRRARGGGCCLCAE
jgi:hypothetical protein